MEDPGDSEDAKWYYFTAIGLQIDEPRFSMIDDGTGEAGERPRSTSGEEEKH
jgi:hypothetical protein